jgi:hypothetical protein
MLLVPFLAIAAGVALESVTAWLSRWPAGRTWLQRSSRPAFAALVAAAFLALALAPGTVTVAQAARQPVAPDTRTLAIAWIHEHLPAGSSIAREVYTPQVGPEYRVQQTFYLSDLPLGEYRRLGVRYLIASESAYARFLAPGGDAAAADFYAALFTLPEIGRIVAGPGEQGPLIRVFDLGLT